MTPIDVTARLQEMYVSADEVRAEQERTAPLTMKNRNLGDVAAAAYFRVSIRNLLRDLGRV